MAEPARPLVTVDGFYAFEGDPDTSYELFDGAIVAMASASDRHGAIAANASFEITRRLRARPPCVAIAEVGI